MENTPKPRTNEEKYLYSILLNQVEGLPTPRTNEDFYLEAIAKKLGYLISARPKSYTIEPTDWVLGDNNKYYCNITHNINSENIIWNAWEREEEGGLSSTILEVKLLSEDVMQILSEKNTEVKIVINAIV